MTGQPVRSDLGGEYVRLDVPASSEQLRLVRLVVVGLATSHGADVDDLEDVRIATGEICAHLVGRSSDGDRLLIEARVEAVSDGAQLHVGASVDGLVDDSPLDELSAMVLMTTSERHGIDVESGVTTAWFERSVRAADGGAEGGSHPDA